MAHPAGIIKRTVTFGPAFELEDGENVGMKVTFTATRPGLLWRATGQPGISSPFVRTAEDGVEESVDLPVTNQVGWGDGDGNAIDPGEDGHVFLYLVTIEYFQGGRTIPGVQPRKKVVPVPQGDGPIDLDDLIPLTTPGGTTVSIEDQWSALIDEAGMRAAAAEAAAELAAASLLDSDGFVAGRIADPDSATGEALAAKIEADSGLDLWLLLGQSNMSGRGTAFDARLDPTDSRVLQFGASGTYAGVISQAVEPLAMVDTPSGIGPGLGAARWIAPYLKGGRRILLIPGAKGGTPFRGASSPAGWTWKIDRSDVTNLYAAAIAQTKAALAAAGPGSRIAGVLWVQGETDGDNNTSGPNYQADFDALIDGLRTTFALPNLPFVVGQMVPDYLATGTRTAIDAVHAATPTRKAHTAFAHGLPMSNNADGNHYDAPGQRFLARSMAQAARALSTGVAVTAPGAPTGLVAGSPTSNSVALRWDPQPDSIGYVIQRRPAGGGSWVNVMSALGTTAIAAGLAAMTGYDFRVVGYNSAGAGTPSLLVTATTAAPVPLLDLITPQPLGAYSMNKLRSAYSGSAIRVRRSSDDTEQDIAFASGSLDADALAAFAGAGSAYITTWYDQSGNGKHFVQTTAAAQPRIYNAGVQDPRPLFDGTDDYLQLAGSLGLYAAGAATMLAVIKAASQASRRWFSESETASATAQYTLGSGTSTSGARLHAQVRGSGSSNLDAGGSVDSQNGVLNQVGATDTGTSIVRYVNGVGDAASAYVRTGGPTPNIASIGAIARSTVAAFFAGEIAELVLYGSVLSTTDRQALEANQRATYGTP